MPSFATRSMDYGSPHTQKFDNSGGAAGNLVLYAGRADPGATSSEAKWQIYKLTYDGNDNVTDIKWASGDLLFNKIWDNRASYIYS